jgi:hypothetical protein
MVSILGKLLLAFSTTVILGSGSCGNHDHIFLSTVLNSSVSCISITGIKLTRDDAGIAQLVSSGLWA